MFLNATVAANLYLREPFSGGSVANWPSTVEEPWSSTFDDATPGLRIGRSTHESVAAFPDLHKQNVIAVRSARATTPIEEIVGEIRGWALFPANWDGENSQKPQTASLESATQFIRLLAPKNGHLPEPMLLASGRAGFYWDTGEFQADLEFWGDGRITYFVRRGSDKHKGMVRFEGESVPTVLSTLLSA